MMGQGIKREIIYCCLGPLFIEPNNSIRVVSISALFNAKLSSCEISQRKGMKCLYEYIENLIQDLWKYLNKPKYKASS